MAVIHRMEHFEKLYGENYFTLTWFSIEPTIKEQLGRYFRTHDLIALLDSVVQGDFHVHTDKLRQLGMRGYYEAILFQHHTDRDLVRLLYAR